jgi:hypothetical protein
VCGQLLLYGEIATTVIFGLEMALRVVAYGFVLQKKAYLRDPWNAIDFFVVMVRPPASIACGCSS